MLGEVIKVSSVQQSANKVSLFCDHSSFTNSSLLSTCIREERAHLSRAYSDASVPLSVSSLPAITIIDSLYQESQLLRVYVAAAIAFLYISRLLTTRPAVVAMAGALLLAVLLACSFLLGGFSFASGGEKNCRKFLASSSKVTNT